MKVTVVYDRQNNEVIAVYKLSESAVRKIYIKEAIESEMAETKSDAEYAVDQDLEITAFTVQKR